MDDDFRSFSKPPRFDLQHPRENVAKVLLPGITQEEAQALVTRFFKLWPEAGRYLEKVRRHAQKD